LSLIKTVADQTSLNFTGKINVLEKGTNKYLGKITLLEGSIVFANYKGGMGKAALFHIVIDDLETENLSYVVEPEIVTLSEAIFDLSFENFKRDAEYIYSAYSSARKFRPPPHLRLLITPDFVPKGPSVSYAEFEVLTVISDFNKVSDIFSECSLLEYQTCNALVSLRKKGALKVIG